MVDPVSAGLTAVSVGTSIYGGLKARKAAKKAAREQAKFTFARRQEEIRQQSRAAEQQAGLARAQVYASNIQMSGSARRYVSALNMENMREIAYARQAAREERKAIRAGAAGAGNALFMQAAGDLIGFGVQSYLNRDTLTDAEVDTALDAEQYDFGE